MQNFGNKPSSTLLLRKMVNLVLVLVMLVNPGFVLVNLKSELVLPKDNVLTSLLEEISTTD